MVVVELGFERHVGGFREHALLFEDGQDSQRLQGEGAIKMSELSAATSQRGIPCVTEQGEARLELGDLVFIQTNGTRHWPWNKLSLVCSRLRLSSSQSDWDQPGLQDMGACPGPTDCWEGEDPLQYPDKFGPFQKTTKKR